ncbi:MAG: hypothetical protein QOJ92_398 [Frankiales bacterium]|nr:hypothetical protein [Frankiales bacterium]
MRDALIELLREEAERRSAETFSAPSPTDVRRAAGRRRRATVAAGASMVVLIGAGVAVANQAVRDGRTTSEPTPTRTPGPQTVAQQRSADILDGVVLPEGAQSVDGPPTTKLQQPELTFRAGSEYVVRDSRFWTVAGTLASVSQFFLTHDENGMRYNGYSGSPNRGQPIVAVYFGDLLFSLDPVDASTVGIRADTSVAWTPDRAASERIPDSVDSVEIRYYLGSAENPLGLRSLSGVEAQHLAELVNALPLVSTQGGAFHGSLPCRGDILQTRLTFVTDTVTFIITWPEQCGGSVVTIDGLAQPTLDVSDELRHAVEALLPRPTQTP